MFTREELLKTPEYWFEQAQNELYRHVTEFMEKEGINAGTSGFVRYYPDTDVTIAMLSNMENGVWGPRRYVHEMVYE